MILAICQLSMVPVRSGPSDSDPMVTQLLFGEQVEILGTRKGWSKVRCLWDDVTGWVAPLQLMNLGPDVDWQLTEPAAVNLETAHTAVCDDYFLTLPLGCSLPGFDGMRFQLGNASFHFGGQVIWPGKPSITPDRVVKFARRYLYAPELSGGRSPFGIDGPGLIQMIYKMAGIRLPRLAHEQARQGETIGFIEEAQPGDLVFFDNGKAGITHVGILTGTGGVIHAYGRVRLDSIDHQGIMIPEHRKYTFLLRVIKRLLPDWDPQVEDHLPQPAEAPETDEHQISLF